MSSSRFCASSGLWCGKTSPYNLSEHKPNSNHEVLFQSFSKNQPYQEYHEIVTWLKNELYLVLYTFTFKTFNYECMFVCVQVCMWQGMCAEVRQSWFSLSTSSGDQTQAYRASTFAQWTTSPVPYSIYFYTHYPFLSPFIILVLGCNPRLQCILSEHSTLRPLFYLLIFLLYFIWKTKSFKTMIRIRFLFCL